MMARDAYSTSLRWKRLALVRIASQAMQCSMSWSERTEPPIAYGDKRLGEELYSPRALNLPRAPALPPPEACRTACRPSSHQSPCCNARRLRRPAWNVASGRLKCLQLLRVLNQRLPHALTPASGSFHRVSGTSRVRTGGRSGGRHAPPRPLPARERHARSRPAPGRSFP